MTAKDFSDAELGKQSLSNAAVYLGFSLLVYSLFQLAN